MNFIDTIHSLIHSKFIHSLTHSKFIHSLNHSFKILIILANRLTYNESFFGFFFPSIVHAGRNALSIKD